MGVLPWDSVQPGLVLRVYPNGRKVFFAFYRVGSGRKAPLRWDWIGDAGAIALKDARDAAKARMGAVAKAAIPPVSVEPRPSASAPGSTLPARLRGRSGAPQGGEAQRRSCRCCGVSCSGRSGPRP